MILELMNPSGNTVIESEQNHTIEQHPKKAILLFTHSPEAEAHYKPLMPEIGYRGNQKIARLLINRSRRIAQKTGIDLIVYDTNRQRGDSFGERFTRAFEEIFDQGYSTIVAIGNDTPALTVTHLNEAFRKLKDGKAVLGPSGDGGVYLIGLTKAIFDRQKFISVPWKTAQVLSTLSRWLEQAGGMCQLEELRDLDSEYDLNAYLKYSNRSIRQLYFINKLKSLLSILEISYGEGSSRQVQSLFHGNLLRYRGPPSAVRL